MKSINKLYQYLEDQFSSDRFGIHSYGYAQGMAIAKLIEKEIAELEGEINGDTSDGYHTFNELYHHRAVLFSVIVRDHRKLAWKARKHYDGTMYEGMFIVGIETPKGQATYHYDFDPYWEMFDCKEREYAPEWDGHTPDEAIARIAELKSSTLTAEQVRKAIRKYAEDDSCYIFEVYGEMCGLIANELNAELGSGNADTDDALALLDEIREAGRISYDDYSQLFDAIAELGSGTRKMSDRITDKQSI